MGLEPGCGHRGRKRRERHNGEQGSRSQKRMDMIRKAKRPRLQCGLWHLSDRSITGFENIQEKKLTKKEIIRCGKVFGALWGVLPVKLHQSAESKDSAMADMRNHYSKQGPTVMR